MKYIEAINEYKPKNEEKTIFIAGGISGTKKWQPELVEMLKNENITIFNPRRKYYKDSEEAAQEQIAWECKYILKVDAVSFWFPKETLCPITLYELGKISAGNQKIFIGLDPEYKRKLDVECQTRLVRPDVQIVYSMEDLAKQIKRYFGEDAPKKPEVS